MELAKNKKLRAHGFYALFSVFPDGSIGEPIFQDDTASAIGSQFSDFVPAGKTDEVLDALRLSGCYNSRICAEEKTYKYIVVKDESGVTVTEIDVSDFQNTLDTREKQIRAVCADLQIPLSNIVTLAKADREKHCELVLPAGELSKVEAIQCEGERLENMVFDILDFSNLRAGQIVLNLQAYALRPLVDYVIVSMQSATVSEGQGNQRVLDEAVSLINDVDTNVFILADKFRLKQILFNLIGNACKFTHEGSVVVSSSSPSSSSSSSSSSLSSLARSSGGDRVEVRVTDTGPGIKPEDLITLFDEYTQVENSPEKAKGTGLGLAICKDLVILHGGKLEVESTFGEGSTFKFSLQATSDTHQSPNLKKIWTGDEEEFVYDESLNRFNLFGPRQQGTAIYRYGTGGHTIYYKLRSMIKESSLHTPAHSMLKTKSLERDLSKWVEPDLSCSMGRVRMTTTGPQDYQQQQQQQHHHHHQQHHHQQQHHANHDHNQHSQDYHHPQQQHRQQQQRRQDSRSSLNKPHPQDYQQQHQRDSHHDHIQYDFDLQQQHQQQQQLPHHHNQSGELQHLLLPPQPQHQQHQHHQQQQQRHHHQQQHHQHHQQPHQQHQEQHRHQQHQQHERQDHQHHNEHEQLHHQHHQHHEYSRSSLHPQQPQQQHQYQQQQHQHQQHLQHSQCVQTDADPLTNCNWFVGTMSRSDAEQRLTPYEVGTLLVRVNSNNNNVLSLKYKRQHDIMQRDGPEQYFHVEVTKDPLSEQFYIATTISFADLPSLIRYYTQNSEIFFNNLTEGALWDGELLILMDTPLDY